MNENLRIVLCGISAENIPYRENAVVSRCEEGKIVQFLLNEETESTLVLISERVLKEQEERILSAMRIKGMNVAFVSEENSAEEIKRAVSGAMYSANEKEIVRRVTEILDSFCITANLKGKSYLRQAICSVVKDESMIYGVVKNLYVFIAQQNGSTVSKAERCMRFAISTGWSKATSEIRKEYFGSLASAERTPTNTEFIANIAERVRFEMTGYGI